MGKMLKILSIDWDYFPNCDTKTRIRHFPDGNNENVPEIIDTISWAMHYATYPKLKNIGVREAEYQYLIELFKTISGNENIQMYFSNIHKLAYHVIKDAIEDNPNITAMQVINIDYHHDLYDFTPDFVDSGNWIMRLDKDLPPNIYKEYIWIANPDSDFDTWNKSKLEHKQIFHPPFIHPLCDVIGDDFDIIYISKSSVWSPPHLDKYLVDLISILNPDISERVGDRYTSDFLELVSSERKLYLRL